MRIRRSLLVAVVCAGASVARAQEGTRPLTDAEKTIVRSAIEAQLTDPASATYKWLDVRASNLPPRYCVEVNSKNRYGGYVGYTPVMVQTTIANGSISAVSKVWFPNPSIPQDRAFQVSACKGYGYDVAG